MEWRGKSETHILWRACKPSLRCKIGVQPHSVGPVQERSQLEKKEVVQSTILWLAQVTAHCTVIALPFWLRRRLQQMGATDLWALPPQGHSCAQDVVTTSLLPICSLLSLHVVDSLLVVLNIFHLGPSGGSSLSRLPADLAALS